MTVLSPVHGLTELSAIPLEELTATAPLLTRVDRKYLLSGAQHGVLADLVEQVLVPGGARVLEIDGRRSFGYRSVYLDTPENSSHRGAARGRRRRFKVRVRTYLDTGQSTLEVKTRGGRGATVKERAPFAGDVLTTDGHLAPASARYVEEMLAEAGVPGTDVAGLRPALTTSYQRSTVLLPASGARLTVDAHLALHTREGDLREHPGLLVVETKNPTRIDAGVRAEADRFLWSCGVRPARFSKYGTGRVLMDPDLPANRWHRTISRHLSAQEPS